MSIVTSTPDVRLSSPNVITVSLETVKIVKGLLPLAFG
jgi:hypothetical protein